MRGHDASHWLRTAVAAAIFARGEVDVCEHADTAPVLNAYAWRPRLYVCTNCAHRLTAPAGDDNYSCDRCGDIDRDRLVLLAATEKVAAGFLAPPSPKAVRVFVALCHACAVREGVAS